MFLMIGMFLQVFGFIWGGLLFFATIGFSIYVLRAGAIGLANLDATLIKTPLLGPLYERLFRKETYYRKDTRIMYLDTIPVVVKKLVEDVTAAKGVKLTDRIEETAALKERTR